MNYRSPGQNAVMDNQNNSGSPVARMIPVIIFFVGLLGIYYLYQYLFGARTANQYILLSEQKPADTNTPIKITADKLPVLYEGGEFTVSTWIYVSNWNYRAGYNKSILRLGGDGFDTIRIYLGGNKPKVHVRIHTKEQQDTANTTTTTPSPGDDLAQNTLAGLFGQQIAIESGLTDSGSPMCDLPEIDLQRWVNIAVAVNGKTVDVYMDGKLVRSCVLPSFYKVDASTFSVYLASNGGFGGYIASTLMYDAAMNPDVIYRNYIAGPEPITSIGDWIRSIFNFGVNVSVDTK
jgi:hypothetical protein